MALTEAWFQQVIDREVEDVELVLLEEAGNRRQTRSSACTSTIRAVSPTTCARGCRPRWAGPWTRPDAVEGPYTLEVSSPGIERPLRKRSHFEAQVGKKVYVKTRHAGRRAARSGRGSCWRSDDDGIVVDEAGREARIPLGEITSAHLIYEFR